MRKDFLFSAAFLIFFLTAESSFAAKICLQENNTNIYWELKGGKTDKKSYTLKRIVPTLPLTVSGFAEVTSTDTGSVILGALTGHADNGLVPVILWSAIVDENFNGSGLMDVDANGTIDGILTLNKVNCSLLIQSKKEFE